MPEKKTIVKWFVNSVIGGPYWAEIEPKFYPILAYGWYDGSVTWKP